MVEDLYRSYGFPLTASVISISFLMNSQLCARTKFKFTFLKHAFLRKRFNEMINITLNIFFSQFYSMTRFEVW